MSDDAASVEAEDAGALLKSPTRKPSLPGPDQCLQTPSRRDSDPIAEKSCAAFDCVHLHRLNIRLKLSYIESKVK